MAVISMDALDQAVRRATPRRNAFQRRNAVASLRVGNDKQPTEFGYRLLKLMSDAGLKPAQLARAAGTSGSTITRLVYGGVGRPDSDTLGKVARALVEAELPAGTPPGDLSTAVEDKHNELLHAAGYRIGAAPAPPATHRYAVELDQMIGAGTPLSDEDVRFLEVMVDRLMDPYRRKLRRRTG